MLINRLPLLVGIFPLLAVTLAHWLGAETGRLPACIPYIEGCTSISATGRYPPGSFAFKAVTMPMAAALVFIWYFVSRWLESLHGPASKPPTRWIMAFGVLAAVALILYTTFLGTREPLYEFMRRFGIYLYFAGTVAAQLTVSLSLCRHAARAPAGSLSRIAWWMRTLTLLPFALGVLNSILKAVLEDADQSENRIEWIVTLCMQAWFVLLYLAWRESGFRIAVDTGTRPID